MNKLMKCLCGMVLFSAIICQDVTAKRIEEKIGATATGIISYSSNTAYGTKQRIEFTIANEATDPDDSAIDYNPANTSLATDGWINVQNYNDAICIRVDLSTLASTGIDVTFWGLFSDKAADQVLLYTKSFSATDANYKVCLAEEGLKWIRVGRIATGSDDTDAVSITGFAEGRIK